MTGVWSTGLRLGEVGLENRYQPIQEVHTTRGGEGQSQQSSRREPRRNATLGGSQEVEHARRHQTREQQCGNSWLIGLEFETLPEVA